MMESGDLYLNKRCSRSFRLTRLYDEPYCQDKFSILAVRRMHLIPVHDLLVENLFIVKLLQQILQGLPRLNFILLVTFVFFSSISFFKIVVEVSIVFLLAVKWLYQPIKPCVFGSFLSLKVRRFLCQKSIFQIIT